MRSGPGALDRLRRALRGALVLDVRRPEARAFAMLAVEEAAANILEHGYGGEPGRPLAITLVIEAEERFTVTLRDRAPVRDVTEIPPANLRELADRLAERGRGLAMVRTFTESVTHRERPGGGNELVLVFDAVALSRRMEESLDQAS